MAEAFSQVLVAHGQSTRSLDFLDLPIEIRLEVYRHLIKPETRYCPFDNVPVQFAGFGFHPTILRTNKRINGEASVVFYGENTWHLIVGYDFNLFRVVPGPDNLQSSSFFPRMRNFHLRFSLHGYVLDEYPSFSLENYCAALRIHAANTCQVLAKAPHLRSVEISWVDSTDEGSWEEKRGVLKPLEALPRSCSYRICGIDSKYVELNQDCLAGYLSGFMKAKHPPR